MHISLSPELERRITDKVRSGEYGSPEAFVAEAVQAYLEWQAGELQEARDAVDEAIAQSERDEGVFLEEFDRMMREKHAIPH